MYSACKGTRAYDEINNFRATGHEPRGFAVFDTLLYYAATPVTAGTRHPGTGVWVAGPAVAGAQTRPRTNTHARLSLAERRPVPPRLSNGTTAAAAAAVIFTRPRRISCTSISHTPLYSLLGPGHGQTTIAPPLPPTHTVHTLIRAPPPSQVNDKHVRNFLFFFFYSFTHVVYTNHNNIITLYT